MIHKLLHYAAIFGDAMYILWNAVDERAQGVRPMEAIALSGLLVLLVLTPAQKIVRGIFVQKVVPRCEVYPEVLRGSLGTKKP